MEGLFTLELYAQKRNIARQTALNELSNLKKKGFVTVSGGGKKKRLYRVSHTKIPLDNGIYSIVNKYSPEKLAPVFIHKTYGNYSVERAIVDAIQLGDIRTNQATMHLFRHVTNWKKLFSVAQKKGVTNQVIALYNVAKKTTKVKRIPQRYINDYN